jgi:hypothetical protein
MEKFTINGEGFEFPTGWQDITLERYMLYLEHIETTMPEKLRDLQQSTDKNRKDALDAITELCYATEVMPFYARYFCFFTGVPMDMAQKLKVELIEKMYQQIERNLARSLEAVDKVSPTIEHKDELYYLPEKYMQKSTVIEFIETAQFEHYAREVEGNQFKALPKLLCVLLRPKGEVYDSENNPAREKLFMSLTMDKVWSVCFFLLRLNARFAGDSATFMAVLQTLLQNERALEKYTSNSVGT